MSTQPQDGNPTSDAHYDHPHSRRGFFTDTSICIGCKACEVACKEWNRNPADGDYQILGSSYDNTGALGADTWRHVAFVEQDGARIQQARESGRKLVSLGMPQVGAPAEGSSVGSGSDSAGGGCGSGGCGSTSSSGATPDTPEFRWLMSSDVCKHCTNAGCLDVCPTGALFRTEYGTVVVQDDICNGCGTCVAGCPFGVIERRDDGLVDTPASRQMPDSVKRPQDGVAQKCTLCYDRMKDDETPACAKTCPTTSIKYGQRQDMLAAAQERVAQLHQQGMTEARLYGANPNDGVGGTGSIFLLLDEPEVYGLPPDPRVPTADLAHTFKRAGVAMAGMALATAAAFVAGGRR